MNVLILTPDAVGSTLLQRVLTVYMQFHEYDQPVINLHELTNGLVKSYSADFNREIIGKPTGAANSWGYFQSLEEIVQLLESVDHYKTARVAEYHMRGRKDPQGQQVQFYRYLNDNFYIISCRRQNVFEHALSWELNKITKRLNVYSAGEKVQTFLNLYRDRIEIDPDGLRRGLEDYKIYLKWCDDHFHFRSHFNYEQDVPNIENYVLGLPVFAAQKKRVSWHDTFGLSFNDWNRCHRITSDIGSIALNAPDQLLRLEYNSEIQLGYNADLVTRIVTNLPQEQQDFFAANATKFFDASRAIARMGELGIMLGNGIPIKKQTFAEKRVMIKNFQECTDVYNEWISRNPTIGRPIDTTDIAQHVQAELEFWNSTTGSTQMLPAVRPTD
jgi:hypothetical protein